jgi:hypothetical protein
MAHRQVGVTKQWVGLSTDTKPSGDIGDEFYETDTGKTYVYDSTGSWTVKD